MMALLAVVVAYLLGAIPFGYILVKWKTGADVRASGSGNIGATNVLRAGGRAAGIATLLLDIAKGYAAVWIAGRLTAQEPLWMAAAALAAVTLVAFTSPVCAMFWNAPPVLFHAPQPEQVMLAGFELLVKPQSALCPPVPLL